MQLSCGQGVKRVCLDLQRPYILHPLQQDCNNAVFNAKLLFLQNPSQNGSDLF